MTAGQDNRNPHRVKPVSNDLLFEDIEKLLHGGSEVTIRVKGNSMRTFLRDDKDTATLCLPDGKPLRKGMVILFRYNGKHVLHRLYRIKGDKLVLRGDGNVSRREVCNTEDVVAMVTKIKRGGKICIYGSARWKALTFASGIVKMVRTVAVRTKRTLKKLVKR